MDARRLLILALAAGLAGCAALPKFGLGPRAARVHSLAAAPPPLQVAAVAIGPVDPPPRVLVRMAPIADPPLRSPRRIRRHPAPTAAASGRIAGDVALAGPAAIAAANSAAMARSQAGDFQGGVQVFPYEPGRVYEVWTAPLRVTTLTLSPGETVISKAAGDTVRWQIGETQSGEGAERRAHVMIKPLARGLETNLVLATSRRLYLIELHSGAPEAFNAVVTWDGLAVADSGAPAPVSAAAPALVTPQGPLDAHYRIMPRGRPPAWTPTAVMTDGVHTFLRFPPQLQAGEAPGLFALGPDGRAQLLNYRQQGGLWVVDRVLDAAELRLGGRKADVVKIQRIGDAS